MNIKGLTQYDWKAQKDLLKKANYEQLIVILSEVENEIKWREEHGSN